MEGSSLIPSFGSVTEASPSIFDVPSLVPLTVVHESCQPDFEASGLNPALPSIKSSSYDYVRTGQGEVSRFDCGEFKLAIACVNLSLEHRHQTTQKIFKHCKKFTCPSCYHSAVGQSARRITSRITKLAVKYRDRKVPIGRSKHIVFSPPPGTFAMSEVVKDAGKSFFAELDRLQRFAAKDGFFAGVNILHMERQVDDQWFPGEHGHFYGYGYFMDSDEFYAKTGWTYKIIEDDGPRDCYSTVYYQLTHCANFINRGTGRAAKNFRYVGAFQDKVARRVVLPSTIEPVLCDHCKVPMHKFDHALDFHCNCCFDEGYEVDLGECYRLVPHEDWVIKEKGEGPRRRRSKASIPSSSPGRVNDLRSSGAAVHESYEAYDYDLKQWLGFNHGSDDHKRYLEQKRGANDVPSP